MDDVVEFVGLSLVAGPPVGHLHLPLRSGITALYGENGVGKSQILNAVAKMLSGLGVNPRPSWTDERDSHSRPAPSGLSEVAYLRGGVHLRLPMTPESSGKPGDWRPAFIDEIEQRLDAYPPVNELLSADQLLAERWQQIVGAVRADLPWSDSTDAEAEYLLRHGRWLLVADSATTCLCDPSPMKGPLALRWAASNELWRVYLQETSGGHPPGFTHERGPKNVVWYSAANAWSIPSWRSVRGLGGSEPCLPPTPDVLGLPEWPEWAGFPILLGPRQQDPMMHDEPVVMRPVLESGDSAVDHTVRRVASLQPRVDGTWEPHDALNRIVDDANEILAAMFAGRLVLSACVSSIRDWFRGEPPVQWLAAVDGRAPIALDRLGTAHSRFSSFAIQHATSGLYNTEPYPNPIPGSRPQRWLSAAVIDEPERALHQAAIGDVAGGLSAIAEHVIVASHALEVLSFADTRFLVTVDDFGLVRVEPPRIVMSSASLIEQAVKLGVTPDRVAARADVILLVEGQHDVEVLKEFLSPELDRHFLLLVALGGTEGLNSVADATFLFNTSVAPIVICLDSLDTAVGDDLAQLTQLSSLDKQRRKLATMRADPRYKVHREMKALLALFAEACEQDRLDRFDVHAFTKPDIVRYIDVELISSRPGSWEDLELQFLKTIGQTKWRAGDGVPFKKWVGPKYAIPGVRSAAHEQVARWANDLGTEAHRHPDFGKLGALLDQLHH